MSGNVSSGPNQNITGLPRYPPVTLKDWTMAKALTVQSVERFKPDPNKRLEVADGLLPGLYLLIQPSGARSWAVRYRHASKPRKLTLGPDPVLDLSVARARAREALQVVALGRDPASEKQDTLKAARLAEPGVERWEPSSPPSSTATRAQKRRPGRRRRRRGPSASRPANVGERRIQDITRRDVIGLLDRIVDQGAPIAAGGAIRYRDRSKHGKAHASASRGRCPGLHG